MAIATLRVLSPAGVGATHELVDVDVVIGRRSPTFVPDVVLEPDPDRWVGRSHCRLVRDEGRWWVLDNGSVNGTLLRRAGHTSRLESRSALQHGDTLLILGGADDDGTSRFWELVLLDPHETQSAPDRATPATVALRYDWLAARAHRREGAVEHPLDGLRPQGHRLVRHMAERGRDHGTVACSHDELIAAVWGGAAGGYTRSDLAGLVRDVRRAIEADPSHPQLLQTVTGFGYRLVVHPDGGTG
jgi:hypothetical protein